MKYSQPEQLLKDLWAPNANDRMKAQWHGWVARSTLVGVVLHVGVVGLWPTWERSARQSEPLRDFFQLERVTVLDAQSPLNVDPAPPVHISEIPDSIPTEADLVASASGLGVQTETLSEAFRERLIGRSAPRPTITQPEMEGDEEGSTGSDEGEGSISIERRISAADFSEQLSSNPLDLERLAAVRPELVLSDLSAWVLLRNPTEVEMFIRRIYRRGELDRSANGTVSVALWIDKRGSVEWAEISRSSGRSDVDQVALALFSEVVAFRAARVGGVPVSRSVIFSVRFPW